MMERDITDLSEKQLDSERIYDGRIINVRVDSVLLPNGTRSRREVVEHRPAVVIAAENAQCELLLIRQFRYAVGREIIELPAGIVEPGEDAEDAARRELQEETGWRPARLEHIASAYSSPGFSDELFELYYASDLAPNSLDADADEFVIPKFCSRGEIERMLAKGEIIDAKTLMGIFWWLPRAGTI